MLCIFNTILKESHILLSGNARSANTDIKYELISMENTRETHPPWRRLIWSAICPDCTSFFFRLWSFDPFLLLCRLSKYWHKTYAFCSIKKSRDTHPLSPRLIWSAPDLDCADFAQLRCLDPLLLVFASLAHLWSRLRKATAPMTILPIVDMRNCSVDSIDISPANPTSPRTKKKHIRDRKREA